MNTDIRMSERLVLAEKMDAALPFQPNPNIVFRKAQTENEWLAAARLVWRMYEVEGYVSREGWPTGKEQDPIYISPHHLFPGTMVFVAILDDRVIGTVTVIFDSPAGLPIEDLYSPEISQLREAERTPCEFSSLAVDPTLRRQGAEALLGLLFEAGAHAVSFKDTSDLCIDLKPSHEKFYKRIGFEPFGSYRFDPRFSNTSSIALRFRRENLRTSWIVKCAKGRATQMLAQFATIIEPKVGDRLKRDGNDGGWFPTDIKSVLEKCPSPFRERIQRRHMEFIGRYRESFDPKLPSNVNA